MRPEEEAPGRERRGRPRVLFLGPLLGCHPGWVVSQAEILARLMRGEGWEVRTSSSRIRPVPRLLDQVGAVVCLRRRVEVAVLQVFSGRSFLIEDPVSLACRLVRLPLVMVLRGGAMPQFVGRHPRWARRVLHRARVIVVPSVYLARTAVSLGLGARLIPNTIDLDLCPFRQRGPIRPNLFWMRTFHPIYDPSMAVHVTAALRREFPDVRLVMGGQDKGLETATRRLARDLGLEDCVEFPGFLEGDRKIEEGQRAEVFLNTNRVDNMPVSVLEACAFGIPVVSTAVGGVPDLLSDGETGLLVPEGDQEAMVAAVTRLLRDPVLAASLSRNGRKLAERCAWPAVRAQWETLFAELR